jgi:protein associated with RNAse G/E
MYFKMLNWNGIKHNPTDYFLTFFVNTTTEITVATFKYDGQPHRSWKCELIEQKEDLLVLRGVFDREINHPNLGTIKPGTVSYEYYWLDRWYNVFRFHEPDGSFRNFYCNVNMPPKFENSRLSYIDLDVDLFVSRDFTVEIWDMDEFVENSALHAYPADIIEKVKESSDQLEAMIQNRLFPFDYHSI